MPRPQPGNHVENSPKMSAELLGRFLHVLVEYAHDCNGLLQHISDEIAQNVGDLCIIWIFSAGAAELQVGAVSHCSQAALDEIRAALKKSTYPVQHVGFGNLILQKEIYVGENLSREQVCDLTPPDLWTIMDKVSIKGLAGVPLLAEDSVLGGIFVMRDQPRSRPYNPADISLLQSIAAPLALAMKNSRHFAEIEENRQQLRGLLQKLFNSQEDQFQRLGRELHDHIGQDLTAININVSLIERMLPENYPDALRVRLADANHLVEESVAHMRSLMADFAPPMLDRYGLTAALLWHGQKITKRTGMPVQIKDTSLSDSRLPPHVEIALFRIAEEALNNIARHTQASYAEVELKEEDGFIVIIVSDNGAGFDPQAIPIDQDKHWGLAMMRERARAIGASFRINSAPGTGTKVTLRIPRQP